MNGFPLASHRAGVYFLLNYTYIYIYIRIYMYIYIHMCVCTYSFNCDLNSRVKPEGKHIINHGPGLS